MLLNWILLNLIKHFYKQNQMILIKMNYISQTQNYLNCLNNNQKCMKGK